MRYESKTIDRRAEYYSRVASTIAADPLDFYVRAEKGRKFQAEHFVKLRPAAVQPSVPLPDNIVKFRRVV